MKKPKLTVWQIWNMSFGFFGIQFGFALQNANVSRIFETLGANIDAIPILWIAAPITGLIVQPIIGYMSDKTWNKFGRRRPYFLAGALTSSVALIIMPNSPFLWVAAGTLWIMDASINITMEPFRAFVGDMLPPEQRTTGFSMQSFFIGMGAVIASSLPWMMTNWFGISNVAAEGEIPQSVKFAFYVGASVFLLSVLWTVIGTKEYSPEQIKAFEDTENNKEIKNDKFQFISSSKLLRNAFIFMGLGVILFFLFYFFILVDYGLSLLFASLFAFGVMQLAASKLIDKGKTDNLFTQIINDLYNMPKTMVQLAYVQFFSWFALFAMWIYTTPAVTKHIYGTSDTTSALYNEGADWVGVLMSVYNGFAAITAFAIIWLSKKISRKKVHSVSLIIGGLGLLSFYFIKNPNLLLVSEVGIGMAWAAILSIPYAILTGALPQEKLGVYMGIFNFFIVIPQITAAAILGLLVHHIFMDKAIFALVIGGISMFVAAILIFKVQDE